MSTPQHLKVNVKLRIDEDLRDRLEQLAAKNDRNVAQEMRRALRAHVAAHEEKHTLLCECGHYVSAHVNTSERCGCFPPEGCTCLEFRPATRSVA